MKKILVALVVCCLVFSFSLTATAGPKVPKHVADAMKAEGSDFTFILWFPFVPELGSPFFWSTYLVISNFYERTVRLNVWATALGEAPTLKQYTLAEYERKLLTLKDFGLLGDSVGGCVHLCRGVVWRCGTAVQQVGQRRADGVSAHSA